MDIAHSVKENISSTGISKCLAIFNAMMVERRA
jgi:hypothetical protein